MNLRYLFVTTLLWLFSARLQAAGTGLVAEYFHNTDFTSLYTTQTNAAVDFDWGTGAPLSGMGSDLFSVRWTGSLEPRYSELYTFYLTVDDGARLWVNDRLLVTRTISSAGALLSGQIGLNAGERVNLRVEYVEQTGSARVRLEWASASQARETVPQSQLYPRPVVYERGSILREHWSGLAGTAISALTSGANYPNKPDGREFLLNFECLAQNWADNYGTRVSGFLVPPTNGNYTFAVAADDRAELWLSTDTNPANKQLIASVTNANGLSRVDEPARADFHGARARGRAEVLCRAAAQGRHGHGSLLRRVATAGQRAVHGDRCGASRAQRA